jgi:peptidoglycan LD-endopeptidase CwlK
VSSILLSRLDVDLLYQPMLLAVAEMLEDLQKQGIEFWGVSGFRSEKEQMKLWAQGRTQPGPIVTRAKALESAHNFGLAVDLCRDMRVERNGLQPSWRPEDYAILDRACRLHGLEWGGWWAAKDYPHVQLANYVTADELRPLAALWRRTEGSEHVKLGAVWDAIDDAHEVITPN